MVFLVDQSGSMGQKIAGDATKRKSEAAAAAVNGAILSLIAKSMKGESLPRDYFSVAVIGYGSDVGSAICGEPGLVPISKLATMHVGEDENHNPMFVLPNHEGSRTRMATAFYEAGKLLRPWVESHSTSFPPIVINVSDGMDNDKNPPQGETPKTWAERLGTLSTQAGNLVFFNVALAKEGGSSGASVVFPTSDVDIDNPYGRFLFEISSPLHDVMVEYADMPGTTVTSDSRAFAFNAGMNELASLLDIGTQPIPTQ